jgi:predicted DNA-binding transcriptional regulator AlpA
MPRFYRLYEIVGCKKRGIKPIIPVSRSAWYAGIKAGIYPAPVHIGNSRISLWRESDINELIASAD